MGAYLDAPIKDKNSEYGQFQQVTWGACAMQGWRCGMEDAHIAFEVKNDPKNALVFGVFDGHGGKEIALFCQEYFQKILEGQDSLKKGDYGKALYQTFFDLDEQIKKEDSASSTGTTSCVVLITDDKIYCANAGDSRAVLCSGGTAVALSEDHKPQLPEELARIEKAGHMVEDDRVDGNLALSRALGDTVYKDNTGMKAEDQAVTCKPDIQEQERNPGKDQFIIVACDGIWDCKTNEQCVEFFTSKITTELRPDAICAPVENLLDDCCADNTDDGIGTDNMTAILVQFRGKEQ